MTDAVPNIHPFGYDSRMHGFTRSARVLGISYAPEDQASDDDDEYDTDKNRDNRKQDSGASSDRRSVSQHGFSSLSLQLINPARKCRS
jgi:hypothetical protein